MSGVSGVVNTSANQNVYFKGKKEDRKAKKVESDATKYSKPLKTHTGAFWGGLSAVVTGIFSANARGIVLASGIASAALYLLGGLLADRKINKNRAEFEAKRQEVGDDKLLAARDKHVRFTKNGNVYYKSSVGKKAGLIIGAIASILPLFNPKGVWKGLGTFLTLCTGFITGAVIDGAANKRARKFADKKAEFEANMRAQAEAQANAVTEEQPVMSENV